MIYPLEYQTDYKPYFTVFDPEYREIQDLYDKKIAKCAILGITNPLFLKVTLLYITPILPVQHRLWRPTLMCFTWRRTT